MTRRVPTVALPVHRFELACGARLLVSPRPDSPVTAAQVHLRGGASLDRAGREGTAYLAGSLADQGTAGRSEEDIASALENAGGQVSGSAVGLSGNVVSGEWKLLLEILCELVTGAVYPAERVRRQRQRLLDRLAVEARDPRAQADRLFRKLVYGSHWLGRPPYGSIESVSNIGAADLRRHRRTHWVARRALFAVAGDVDPEAVARLLGRRLRGWKPGRDLGPPDTSWPEPARRTDVFQAQREQVHLCLGHLGVRRKDPDWAALVVMDHVLGTGPGFSNRISRRLRDELGLAYSVHASITASAGVLPGMFQAYIGTSPEHVGTAIEGFLAEMRRIQEEPVAAEELEVARSYVVGSFALGFQRAARRAGWLVSSERYGLGDDALERLPRELAAVTAADVQRVARAHLFPDRCAISAAGPVDRRALARARDRVAVSP